MKKYLALPIVALPLVAFCGTAPALLIMSAYTASAATTGLGDLTVFEGIATDTLALIDKGDLQSAKKRITDFETAWDKAQSRLYHMDKSKWGVIDDAADGAISALRAPQLVPNEAKAKVAALVAAIQHSAAS